MALLLVLLVAHAAGAAAQDAAACRPFSAIYRNGQELCERIFGDAFAYSTDLESAYTMWFFTADNPNDDVTQRRSQQVPDTCQVQYFHKTLPGPEPVSFAECHPWNKSSCCYANVVESVSTLRDSYGPEFRWDRCGPLTQACERFFVQEACFYECDVNAGLFRRFNSSVYNDSDPTHNTWELYKMPIRADYCDAWYLACYEDLFCGDGDFFSCARRYQPDIPQASNADRASLRLGLGIAAGLLGLLLLFLVFLVIRERRGRAVFAPLLTEPPSGTDCR